MPPIVAPINRFFLRIDFIPKGGETGSAKPWQPLQSGERCQILPKPRPLSGQFGHIKSKQRHDFIGFYQPGFSFTFKFCYGTIFYFFCRTFHDVLLLLLLLLTRSRQFANIGFGLKH